MAKREKEKSELVVRRSTALSTKVTSLSDLVEDFDDADLADQQESDNEYSGGRASYHRWQVKNLVRLCPKRKGSRIMYKKVSRHWVTDAGDGKGKPLTCVAELRPARRCYVCEVLAAYAKIARKKADKDECNMQKARAGAYWNLIDMEQPDRGALLSWMPISVHAYVVKETGIEEGEIDKRPWAIEDGFPLRANRNSENKYECKFLTKQAQQLDDECYVGMMDLEAAAAPLTDQEQFRIAKHMAESYDVLEYLDWDDVDLDDDEDEKPKKKAKSKSRDDDDDEDERPKKKAKKVVDDDDEDEKPAKKKKVYVEPVIEMPKTKAKKKSSFDETDDDEDPWDDDDEDEKPKKTAKSKK